METCSKFKDWKIQYYQNYHPNSIIIQVQRNSPLTQMTLFKDLHLSIVKFV